MNFFKKIIAFTLLFSTLCLSACGGNTRGDNGENDNNADNTEESIVYKNIIENGKSDYVIVTPMGRTDIFNAAYVLSQSIYKATGVNLKVVQDTYPEQECEILLGITSREVEGEYADSFNTPDDYSVYFIGKKVMLYGQSEAAVLDAVAYITENFITPASDKILKLPENLAHKVLSQNEYLTLAADSGSEYRIAVNSESYAAAKTLQTKIKQIMGVELPISTDASGADKEIILNDARRSETAVVKKLVGSAFEAEMAVVGKKLVVACDSKEALELMVKDFSDELQNYIFKGKLMIPSDFEKSEVFGKELAKQVLESIGFTMTGRKDVTSSVEVSSVYLPDGSQSDWYYSHHPFMTYFNGKYYIFYSSGRRNEDDLGQKVMMATSTDYKNWTIKPLMDSLQGNHSEEVLTPFGIYEYDGKLTVYIYAYEYARDIIGTNPDGTPLRPKDDGSVSIVKERKRVLYMQTEDGVNWSEPTFMMNWNGGGGNHSPERFGDLLLWAGFGTLSYTTDLTGTSGWKDVKLKLSSGTAKPKAITESSIYQTADGTLIIMSRTNDSKMLAAASFDGGKTWTDMYESNFNDYSAKFQFGTLPDGRYYYVGNLSTARAELMLFTSTDGVHFGTPYVLGTTNYTQQMQGLYKGGNYGYPTTFFDDEYMYVVYSCGKEALSTLRVKLSDIGVR